MTDFIRFSYNLLKTCLEVRQEAITMLMCGTDLNVARNTRQKKTIEN